MTTHNIHNPNCCRICAIIGKDGGHQCSDPGHWIATERVEQNDYYSIGLVAAENSKIQRRFDRKMRFGKDEVRLFLSKFILKPLASIQMRIRNYANSVFANICSGTAIMPSSKDTSDLQTQPS